MSPVVYDTILSAIHNIPMSAILRRRVVYDTILSAIHNDYEGNKYQPEVVYDTILSAIHNKQEAIATNIMVVYDKILSVCQRTSLQRYALYLDSQNSISIIFSIHSFIKG